MHRTIIGIFALFLTACPAKEPRPRASDKSPEACTKFGENCEFSPGKLGTCVYGVDCAKPGCLICQSQH
jgi:hypothetical protein